jgi:hypothetical protein
MSSFVDEVLRIHQRFLVEVIERHNLCPWAEGTRTSGALKRVVILEQDPVDEILALGDEVLVCIVIWPRFHGSPEAFEGVLGDLRRREEVLRGQRSPFVTALFHPELRYGTATAEQLVPLFRRSPDPSVQFIRHAALQSVRSAGPSGKFLFDWSPKAIEELARREKELPVSDRIARDNAVTVEKLGVERILALCDELRAERARSYARFGEG